MLSMCEAWNVVIVVAKSRKNFSNCNFEWSWLQMKSNFDNVKNSIHLSKTALSRKRWALSQVNIQRLYLHFAKVLQDDSHISVVLHVFIL